MSGSLLATFIFALLTQQAPDVIAPTASSEPAFCLASNSGTMVDQPMVSSKGGKQSREGSPRDDPKLDAVLKRATSVIERAPDDAIGYLIRARIYDFATQLDRALADAEKAVALAPHSRCARATRGHIEYAKGVAQDDERDASGVLAPTTSAFIWYQRALADYDEALALGPANALLLALRAAARGQIGDYDGASTDYHAAIALAPTTSLLFYNLALIEAERRDNVRALADLNQALRLSPEVALYFDLRSKVRSRAGDAAGALADALAAARLDPHDSAYRSLVARMRERTGDKKAAEADYSAVLAIAPDNFDALVARGRLEHDAGRHQEAAGDFTAALALKPNDPSVLERRGFAYLYQGATDPAVRDFASALAHDPKSIVARHGLARADEQAGHFDDAITKLRALVEAAPRLAVPRQELAFALSIVGRDAEAHAEIARALAIDPNDGYGDWIAGNIDLLGGDLPGAERDLTRALALISRSAGLHVDLAEVLARLGRLDDADAALERAADLKPGLSSRFLISALVKARRGSLAEADVLLQTATDQAATERPFYRAVVDGQALEIRGEILVLEGRPEDARRAFTAALATFPGDTLARNGLAGLARATVKRAAPPAR